MQHLGRLIQHHITGSHGDPVLILIMVQNEQTPRLINVLINIDDGRDDMGVGGVDVHAEDRAILTMSERGRKRSVYSRYTTGQTVSLLMHVLHTHTLLITHSLMTDPLADD